MDTTTDQLLGHAEFVRRLARGLLSDRDAADDLAQDTLVAALERGSIRSPRAWLAAVARRLAARRLRSESRRARRETASVRRGSAPDPHDLAAQADLQRRLAEAVQALKEPYRSVVLLRYFHDLSPREIARKLDAPYETVHSRLRRAHAQLRARLDATHERRSWAPALAALAWPRRTTRVAVGVAALAAAAVSAALLATEIADPGDHVARASAEHADEGSGPEAAPGTTGGETGAATPPRVATVRATGRVTTLWGAGQPGARVVVMPSTASADYWERYPVPPAPPFETTTAADGSFSIDVPDEIGWALLAHAPGHEWTIWILLPHVRRDFLILRLRAGSPVRGIVVDIAGAPVAGARVRGLAQGAEIPDALVRTGPDGRFEIEDATSLRVDHDILAVLDVGSASGEWRVVLGPAERMTGEILAADGAPAAGARIRVACRNMYGGSAVADDKGRFVVEGLPLREGDRFEVVADGGALGKSEVRCVFARGLHLPLELPPTSTLFGRVVEMRGEDVLGPVPDVLVKDAFQDLGETRTDAEGRFELAGLPEALHERVHVVDERFLADWNASKRTAGEATLVVRRRPVVAGRVVDEHGEPVAGAAFMVVPEEPPPWRSFDAESPGTRVTDERGAYRATAMPGEGMFVWAFRGGMLTGRSETFPLKAGDVREGVVVTVGAGLSLSGTVTDRDGRPVAGAAVVADSQRAYTDVAGRFVLAGLRVPSVAGDVTCRGYQARSVEAAVPGPLAIVLEESLVFRGRLHTADGEPLPHVPLARTTLQGERSQGEGWTRTLVDGSFAFRDQAPVKFGLSLNAPDWELVEPGRTYTAADGVLDVLVRRKSGLTITGHVLREDGQPFPVGDAPNVTALPDGDEDRNRWRHAKCGPDGSFALKGLEDREYVVVVQTGKAVFEEVRIAAGTVGVRILPAPPRRVAGRVLDADGKALAGAEVRALAPGTEPRLLRDSLAKPYLLWPSFHEVRWANTDGSFEFDRIVREKVALWVFHGEHPLLVEVVASGNERIELRLPRGLTLSGVLLDAGRRPAAERAVVAVGADRMIRGAKTDANGAFAVQGLPEGPCDVWVLDETGRCVLEASLPAGTEGAELRLPAK